MLKDTMTTIKNLLMAGLLSGTIAGCKGVDPHIDCNKSPSRFKYRGLDVAVTTMCYRDRYGDDQGYSFYEVQLGNEILRIHDTANTKVHVEIIQGNRNKTKFLMNYYDYSDYTLSIINGARINLTEDERRRVFDQYSAVLLDLRKAYKQSQLGGVDSFVQNIYEQERLSELSHNQRIVYFRPFQEQENYQKITTSHLVAEAESDILLPLAESNYSLSDFENRVRESTITRATIKGLEKIAQKVQTVGEDYVAVITGKDITHARFSGEKPANIVSRSAEAQYGQKSGWVALLPLAGGGSGAHANGKLTEMAPVKEIKYTVTMELGFEIWKLKEHAEAGIPKQ